MRQRASKYRAKPTVIDGIRFASKLEARRYAELKLLEKAGTVAWFIRQPSFDLGGGVIYRADFLVVHNHIVRVDRPYKFGDDIAVHGELVRVEDCKGFETPLFKVKMKLMAEKYPKARVRILTDKDVR